MTKGKQRASGGNAVRIIGGSHRGRKIRFPDGQGLRPTGDRIRETLFNWLQPHLHGARCLDAFAGSGALGFEAASRGAAEVVMLEKSAEAIRSLNDNAAQLGFPNQLIECVDSLARLKAGTDRPCDIIFLDPPFADGLFEETFQLLEEGGWIAREGLIYVENGVESSPIFPRSWRLLKEKQAGRVEYRLWQG